MEWIKTLINGLKCWVNNRIVDSRPNYSENNSNSDRYIENRPIYQEEVSKSYSATLEDYSSSNTTYTNETSASEEYSLKNLGMNTIGTYMLSLNNGTPIVAYTRYYSQYGYFMIGSSENAIAENPQVGDYGIVVINDGAYSLISSFYKSGEELQQTPSVQVYWQAPKTVLASYWPQTSDVNYITTEPTSDNTSDGIKLVVLDHEPEDQYNGYLYIVTEE